MALIRTIHHGIIKRSDTIITTFTASSRQKLVYELNTWFFDFFYASNFDIQQLPPLDDWTHSSENMSCWSIEFPDTSWEVSIRHEIMEF